MLAGKKERRAAKDRLHGVRQFNDSLVLKWTAKFGLLGLGQLLVRWATLYWLRKH